VHDHTRRVDDADQRRGQEGLQRRPQPGGQAGERLLYIFNTALRGQPAGLLDEPAGLSAVLRRAAAEYLRRSRRRRISEAYRRAYEGSPGLDGGFAGWEDEGSWPEK
jgi:hypothetical protein